MNTTVRSLPIGLSPLGRETLGSYLHRLADANHIAVASITQLLGVHRRYRRHDDDPTDWTTQTVTTLAILTSRPSRSLIIALPALQRLDIRSAATPAQPAGRQYAACSLCTASKDIPGLAIQSGGHHECVCLRHRRWLHGPHQHNLDALPEILDANQRHRRLARRHDPATIHHGYLRARTLTDTWITGTSHPDLRSRWTRRLSLLHDDPYGDPHRPTPERIDLATYPETVTLTQLLSSTYWRDHPDFLTEATRRLDTQREPKKRHVD